jgi:two-component system phosphate regulon response regulator OmpR
MVAEPSGPPHETIMERTPHILVVDDHHEIRKLLARYFEKNGLRVSVADGGPAMRQVLRTAAIDLVVLDIMMPGEDGLTLCRQLRQTSDVPIVLLTAVSEETDRIVGLELGADDYVPKPFEMRELLARVRAVLRRAAAAEPVGEAAAAAPSTRQVRFGACVLDLDQRRLFGPEGAEVEISAAEYDLLALFARHPNRPLNRDQIMEQAHNRGWDVFDRSIDLRVMRLRRKIERNPDKPEVIKTVRNVGYVYVPGGEAAP